MRTFNLAGIQKGSVFPIGTMQAAGVSYNWMRDELCQREQLEAERDGKNIYDCINSQIAQVPFGANGCDLSSLSFRQSGVHGGMIVQREHS